MGGEIGVESKEGQGTTFGFTLEVGIVADSEGGAADGPAEALRNVRVLAVESNPIYQRILTEQLEDRLSPTSAFMSTGQALESLRQAAADAKPFAVALVPYGAAETATLMSAVQSDPRLRGTALVAVVEIDDRTPSDVIKRAGYFARLHRPLTQSRVLDTIASATVQRPGPDARFLAAPVAAEEPLSGLHLLVAEDNEMNQFVTQETLRRVGCTCEIVADGLLAVQAVARQQYAAVLMDCQMPGMDGLEAARRIREWEAATAGARRVPIIALTAEAIQGDRERCLSAGMDGYVTKPIDAEELFAAIRSLVRTKDPALSPPTSGPITREKTPVPQASAASEDAPIDAEALFNRCMRDSDFATRTLEKFSSRAMGDVEELRRGVAARDVEGATRLAHNLKAAAGHVAAASLRKIAFEIEQAGVRSDLEFIEQNVAALDVEARRCAAFLPDAIKAIAAFARSAA